jgi:hypothetical protein
MVSHPPTDLELSDTGGEVGLGGGLAEDVAETQLATNWVRPGLSLDISR